MFYDYENKLHQTLGTENMLRVINENEITL